MLTAETQRTQSLLFDLFSFERKENRYQQALRRYSHSIHNCVISMTCYYLHCHHAVRSFLFWPLSRKENIYSLCELCVWFIVVKLFLLIDFYSRSECLLAQSWYLRVSTEL